MTTTARRTPSGVTGRVLGVGYGAVVYVAFLVVFLYSVAFVADASIMVAGTELVPRTVDGGGPVASTAMSLVVDVLLLSLFAVQHSVMARAGFKRWWTRIVPAPLERSTYVLSATACLGALMWWWHPMTGELWEVPDGIVSTVLRAVSLAGWLLVLLSTFLINHVDLFGLRQVVANARRRTLPPDRFVTPLWYGVVRHPIYLGFLIAFWVTPVMTVGQLLFAVATTGYIVVGIQLEERDLVRAFGEQYASYRRRVPMLVPGARPD